MFGFGKAKKEQEEKEAAARFEASKELYAAMSKAISDDLKKEAGATDTIRQGALPSG